MPSIPDLSKSANTMPSYPPTCMSVAVRRTKTGSAYLWTIAAEWDVTDEHLADVTFPARFQRERQDILRSFKGQGPAFVAHVDAESVCEVSLNQIVNGVSDGVAVIDRAPGLVRSLELRVAEGTCKLRALLRVELPLSKSADLVGLLDTDLHIVTHMQDELPFDSEDGGAGQTAATKRARKGEQATA